MATLAQLKAEMKKREFVQEISQDSFDVNVTLQQIVRGGTNAFMCWGVSQKVNYLNKALMLQVNGRYHKGKVWITLAWDDTYTVYITTNQLKVVKQYDMVYFDMLNDIIDGYIETRK